MIELDHACADARRYLRNFLVDRFRLNELRVADDFMQAKAVVQRPVEQVRFGFRVLGLWFGV